MAWTEQGRSIFAFAVVLSVLSTAAAALRFVCRGRVLRVLGLSDWFLFFTLMFALANTCVIGIQASSGLGLPLPEIPLDEKESFFKLVYAGALVVHFSLILTKISVLLLFLDIFVFGWPRKATYVVVVLVTLFGIWLVVSNILICIPIESFWKQDVSDRRCLGSQKWHADAAVNLVLDVAIFCLPLPIVWPVSLPKRQKLWLYIVFALGFFVCLASALRLAFLVSRPGSSSIGLAYWMALEVHLSIVIACIPTLHPLAVRLCPRYFGRSDDNKTDSVG